MKASELLITKIKAFEGCKLYAYRDAVGIPTIGYGHTSGVKMGMAITMQQADKFLRQDLEKFESYVNSLGVCTTQGQFDALVDFAFNLGCGSLASSTLLKYIKAKKPAADIQYQFRRWNKAGGKILQGLVKRRDWEAKRWIQK